MTYFVLVTGVPKGDESYISMVESRTARSAHSIAISEFRRVRDIPANIHVRSVTALKTDNLAEATLFCTKLSARIAVAEAAIEANA